MAEPSLDIVGFLWVVFLLTVSVLPSILICMLYLRLEEKIKTRIQARKTLMRRVRAMPERFDELQKEIYMLETRLRCQEAEALRRR